MTQIGLLDPTSGPFCVVIDEAELQVAAGEDPFYDVAFHLSHEFAMNAASIARSNGGGRSSRDEGVLRGLVVRSIKLLDRLVDETIRQHGEMQTLISRLVLETGVNLKYLLTLEEMTQVYIEDGMVAPLRRRDEIRKRIDAGGGIVRAIEDRQLRSIEDEFALAGFDPASKPQRLPSMDQRIKVAYGGQLPLVYDFGYRIGSAGVHGGWKDLLSRHITSTEEFEPILEWREADVQVVLSALLLLGPALEAYATHVGDEAIELAFTSFTQRVARVFELYGRVFEARRSHL